MSVDNFWLSLVYMHIKMKVIRSSTDCFLLISAPTVKASISEVGSRGDLWHLYCCSRKWVIRNSSLQRFFCNLRTLESNLSTMNLLSPIGTSIYIEYLIKFIDACKIQWIFLFILLTLIGLWVGPFPLASSPYKSCFGILLSFIRTTWPHQRNLFFRIVASMLSH